MNVWQWIKSVLGPRTYDVVEQKPNVVYPQPDSIPLKTVARHIAKRPTPPKPTGMPRGRGRSR